MAAKHSKLAALVLTLVALGCSPPAPAASPRSFGSFLTHDQPRSSDLVEWNGVVVVRSDPPIVIDAHSRAKLLELPDNPSLFGLATYGKSAVALCAKHGGAPYLLERTNEGFRERALPEDPRRDANDWITVAANHRILLVVTPNRLLRLENGAWTASSVGETLGSFQGAPRRAKIRERRLYLGFGFGEWGGGLVSLDVDQPSWRSENVARISDHDFRIPIRDLELDAHGRLWVVSGISHQVASYGILERLDASGWTLIASSHRGIWRKDDQRGGDWSLPGTAFDAIAFDEADQAYLLTDHLGLVRHESRHGWSQLTPEWPGLTPVEGLILKNKTALIGTFDSGTLVWDIAGKRLTRLAMPVQIDATGP